AKEAVIARARRRGARDDAAGELEQREVDSGTRRVPERELHDRCCGSTDEVANRDCRSGGAALKRENVPAGHDFVLVAVRLRGNDPSAAVNAERLVRAVLCAL